MSHTFHLANDSLGNACLCNNSIICLICKCPKMQNAFGLPRPVNRSIKSKPLKVKAQTWIEIAPAKDPVTVVTQIVPISSPRLILNETMLGS